MKSLRLIMIALSCALQIACSMDTVGSSDVNPQAVHQSLSADYYEDTQQTHNFAQFRVGGMTGTTVALEEPSKLLINNSKASMQSFLGTSYQSKTAGFANQVQFQWISQDGKSYINSINFSGVQVVSATQSIAVSANYIVTLETGPLGPGESIEVVLEQQYQDAQQATQFSTARGVYSAASKSVVFTPASLSKLVNGIALLKVQRKKSSALQQATREGGHISATYHVRPITVNVQGSTAPFVSLR